MMMPCMSRTNPGWQQLTIIHMVMMWCTTISVLQQQTTAAAEIADA
jgi:hypothetical protein